MGGMNQRRRISPLHSELKALSRAMEYMLQLSTCQVFGTDCKNLVSMIQEHGRNFQLNELKELMKLKSRFTEFSIALLLVLKVYRLIHKIAKSFLTNIYYMCCSVPI